MENNLSKEYLAGILDGEGYVGITSRKMSGRRNYVGRVTIVLSDKGGGLNVLKCFKKYYGGKIYKKKIYKYKESFTPTHPLWVYEASHLKARKILTDLLPHLIIKKLQAKLAIKCGSNKTVAAKKGVPVKELKKRCELYLKVKELNK